MKKKSRDIKQAIALHYNTDKDRVPKIVAKGSGFIAEKILEAARKHNIPIQEDPQLVEMMSFFNIGQEIPEEAYRAVAEILAFVYSINDSYKN